MLGSRGVEHQKNIPAISNSNSETALNPTMSIDFPKEEERILARWKEIDAFQRQVELVSAPSTCSAAEARGRTSSVTHLNFCAYQF
jgi:hypothetical protein